MPGQPQLYEDVLRIVEDYFGPVAPRMMLRLIESHLDYRPEQLTKQDLPELIIWIKLTMAAVTEDTSLISECNGRLTALTH